MIFAHEMLQLAACFYCLSFAVLFMHERRRWIFRLFILPALLANAFAVGARYHQAWPLMPMYLGGAATPLFIGAVTLFIGNSNENIRLKRFMAGLAVALATSSAMFPKDFYMPFMKSNTLFSHGFLLFGILGKGCFLAGSAAALVRMPEWFSKNQNGIRRGCGQTFSMTPVNNWIIPGISFWTLSMFSGEVWSYLGWGTPVVWEDAAITTTMATWFYYIGFIHLHFTGAWGMKSRCIYASLGIVVVMVLNCLPDLGPFRMPF